MASARKPHKGFGSKAPSDVDVTLLLKPGTELLPLPTPWICSHTPAGRSWSARVEPSFKEHINQLYADGPGFYAGTNESRFHFAAFSGFAMNACQAGLAVRLLMPGGGAFLLNKPRKPGTNESVKQSIARAAASGALCDWSMDIGKPTG